MEGTDSVSTPDDGYFREFLTELQTPIFLQQIFVIHVSYKTTQMSVMKLKIIALNEIFQCPVCAKLYFLHLHFCNILTVHSMAPICNKSKCNHIIKS